MAEHFPALSRETLAAANLIGDWLAQDDLAQNAQPQLVVLAGNAVIPTIDAACQLAAQTQVPLLISGGIGHSTVFLYDAVRQHPHYHTLPVEGRPESHILADIAERFWNIPREDVVVEDRSTNCGENAWFTREVLEARGLAHTHGVVVQDPTMQRRTMATFTRVWQGVTPPPQWWSYPGCSPQLENSASGLRFSGEQAGLWPVGRYLALLLGELPRLQDNPQGYGPQGKGFIAHVDFPPHISEAWRQLREDSLLSEALAARTLG
ncbi:YdcF family protein [Klebsiella aerogenes]|nr:YdcF family protein [Klebsiella aerogenes]